jgi:hypothetical protein
MIGVVALMAAAHAGAETLYDLSDPNASPPAFSLLPGADPWVERGGSCVSIDDVLWVNPISRAGPRRPLPRAIRKAASALCQSIRAPESSARDISMSSGSAVVNVLTVGAPPNSSITLHIDNRTTVTITVNADPVSSGAARDPAPH